MVGSHTENETPLEKIYDHSLLEVYVFIDVGKSPKGFFLHLKWKYLQFNKCSCQWLHNCLFYLMKANKETQPFLCIDMWDIEAVHVRAEIRAEEVKGITWIFQDFLEISVYLSLPRTQNWMLKPIWPRKFGGQREPFQIDGINFSALNWFTTIIFYINT